MTRAQRDALRIAQQRSPLHMRLLVACAVLAISWLSVHAAQARWKPEYGLASLDAQAWFKNQHNAQGEWCCDESDGHPFYGDYKINDNGSVTLEGRTLPPYMVLKGPNPTGHAVWWYVVTINGDHQDYCFAPGTLS